MRFILKFLSLFLVIKSFSRVIKKVIPYKKSTIHMVMWWLDLFFLILTSSLFIWRLYIEKWNLIVVIGLSVLLGLFVLVLIPYLLYIYRPGMLKGYLLWFLLSTVSLFSYILWDTYFVRTVQQQRNLIAQ